MVWFLLCNPHIRKQNILIQECQECQECQEYGTLPTDFYELHIYSGLDLNLFNGSLITANKSPLITQAISYENVGDMYLSDHCTHLNDMGLLLYCCLFNIDELMKLLIQCHYMSGLFIIGALFSMSTVEEGTKTGLNDDT